MSILRSWTGAEIKRVLANVNAAEAGQSDAHKTSDRMAERAERWAAAVAAAREAEARRAEAVSSARIQGKAEAGAPMTMRDKVRQAQAEAADQDGQR